ncbi:MAG: GNAT family N-acetyltransferase [Pseudomonadota bacterium]
MSVAGDQTAPDGPLTGVTIRRATRTDLQAVIALLADDPLGATREQAGAGSAGPDPAYVAAFDAIASDPNQFLAVAECENTVIATLQLTYIHGLSRGGARRGQIEAVRVARAWRGRGLGRHMIEWAVATCRREGCTLVQLTSDRSRERAHDFYTRLGFTASHLGFKRTI